MNETTKITNDMTSGEIAEIIFTKFTVMQSCKVTDFERDENGRMKAKGELVCDKLWALDQFHNVKVQGARKENRIKRKPPNSIGGYLADKIFRYKITMLKDDVKYTIWRIQ